MELTKELTKELAKTIVKTLLSNMVEEDLPASPYWEETDEDNIPRENAFRRNLHNELMALHDWVDNFQPKQEDGWNWIFALGEGLADGILKAREEE